MSKSLNPKKEHSWNFKPLKTQDIIAGIQMQNVSALSNAITLSESESQEDRAAIVTILEQLKVDWVSNDSIRIGITGPPGVGKSTFIERLGNYIGDREDQVAVLPIDPSSTESKGSILGDKTRMATLATHKNSYIRPNPSRNHLGGMSPSTYSSILLCEAARYNHILLETVGVGQSEVEIKYLTDVVIVLLQPGAGDHLQGIKKGLMEIADILIVHKMDGDQLNLAKKKISQLKSIYPKKIVLGHSSLDDSLSMNKIYDSVKKAKKDKHHREHQLQKLIEIELEYTLLNFFKRSNYYSNLINKNTSKLPGTISKTLLNKLKSINII